MPDVRPFEIKAIAGERSMVNGRVQRRVVLTVEGKQESAERLTLDSPHAIASTAKRWSKAFNIDQDSAANDLRQLNIRIIAEEDQRRRNREAQPATARKRVSDIATEFLESLKPVWHRKSRTLFLEAIDKEVRLGDVWALAKDSVIDSISETVEGIEMSRDDQPANPRVRLALFKDGIRMAASRLFLTIPENLDVAKDATVDRDQLLHILVSMLIRPRLFKSDVAVVNDSYFGWASGLQPGSGVIQCFGHPVFARLDEPGEHPAIGVQGDHLTTEVHYESKRKLATDLRAEGLADVPRRWRCSMSSRNNVWIWVLSVEVLDQIGEPVFHESVEHVELVSTDF